jgi:hypothetical protein
MRLRHCPKRRRLLLQKKARNEWSRVEIVGDLVGHSYRNYGVDLDKTPFVLKLGYR